MMLERDFLDWLWWMFREVIGPGLDELGGALRDGARGNPWWVALLALVALGLWKVLELILWVVRRAWIPIGLGAGVGGVLWVVSKV